MHVQILFDGTVVRGKFFKNRLRIGKYEQNAYICEKLFTRILSLKLTKKYVNMLDFLLHIILFFKKRAIMLYEKYTVK